MSGNRIFGSVKGADPQGRSATLAGSMLKRAPIFNHVASERQQPSSPFANYNCKSAESLYTSESQSSIPEERYNIDTIRQIVLQELSKNRNDDENSKKTLLTLQAQIKDIKQKLGESDIQSSRKLLEMKSSIRTEMKQEALKVGKQVDEEITNRLRVFFQKANTQLKKDILKAVQENFLSFSYGQDLESRLQTINESLENIHSLVQTKEISADQLHKKINSVNISENLESKLTKLQKDAEINKKTINDIHGKIRIIEEWKAQQSTKTASFQELFGDINSKINKIKEENTRTLKESKDNSAKGENLQKIMSLLQMKLDELAIVSQDNKNQNIQIAQRVQLLDRVIKNGQNNTRVLLNGNQCFEQSIVFNNGSGVNETLISKRNSNDSTQISDFANVAVSHSVEFQQLRKTVYQVDGLGYLMDGEGKYILTESGSMIKLDEKQINALIQSKVVQIIDS